MAVASRTTQPYRKGKARPVGSTLFAMLKGRPGFRQHPHTAKRNAQKATRRRRRRAR